jgi:hypothetical protein
MVFLNDLAACAVTFSVLALLIVGLQLMLMLMLNGDQAGGPRNSDQQQGPRNRVEKMVASHRRSKNKQASLHRGKILGITFTELCQATYTFSLHAV